MPEVPRRSPAWYGSLYWRIALGSIAVLAVLLLVQAVVFLWMSGTIATTLLGQSPDRIAADAARDVAAALQKDPNTDIEKFVRDRYGTLPQPLMVVLEDGRAVRNHELPPPDGMRPVAGTVSRRRRDVAATRAGGAPAGGADRLAVSPAVARARGGLGWDPAVRVRQANAPRSRLRAARSASSSLPAATRGPRCSFASSRRRRRSSASSC